jgi:flavin-dependent dehydrogenase
MKRTEITSSIQLAARLTDSLYREGITNADSAQALFDVLADALERRPDIVAAVAEDLSERQREKDEYLADVMKRLDDLEQDTLRQWYANQTRGNHNED